jgi:cobyrinic acid a,c-diamide synthase
MVPRGALPTLPHRHLGLVTADAVSLSSAILDQLADACGTHLDVPAIVQLAREAGTLESAGEGVALLGTPSSAGAERAEETLLGVPSSAAQRVRLGIARDEAFHFYYPDNLEALAEAGAEWVPFSPLADARLPEQLDGLYFGGGYPEVHVARLADNTSLLADVRRFAASGRMVYAECGGMMYLGRSLAALDGARYPLAGVLPIDTAMLPRLKVLGYTGVTWTDDSLWGAAGETARGHEFHYSEITADASGAAGWRPAYTVTRRHAEPELAGFFQGRVLAGYVHLHWASRPQAVRRFLAACQTRS